MIDAELAFDFNVLPGVNFFRYNPKLDMFCAV